LAATARDRLCGGNQAGKVLFEGNSGFLCDAVGIRANSQQKSPHVISGLLILGPGTSTGLDVTSCRHFHSLRNTTPPQSKAIHRRKHRATEYVSGKIKFISYLPRWVGFVSTEDESRIAEGDEAQPSGGRMDWPGCELRAAPWTWDALRRIVHGERGATQPIRGPLGQKREDRER
jgi:hypothetical protein